MEKRQSESAGVQEWMEVIDYIYKLFGVCFKCIHEPTDMSWPLMWAVRPWGPATEENSPLSVCRPASFSAWVSGEKSG